MHEQHATDILILGGGVAGLSFAIKMAERRPDLDILVISKTDLGESNTRYAQGGIATVWNTPADSFEKHISDTLDAGDGLCAMDVVDFVVREGPQRIKDLIGWGIRFDKDSSDFNLGMEGGHSENRILHYKDITGWEMQRCLMEKVQTMPNIDIREHVYGIDLITQHHLGRNVTKVTPDITCFGAYVLDKEQKDIETIVAKVTVVATGGAGQIYRNTTNPTIATGDGIAMVYRAKGRLSNMEFVQFHPTALYNPAGENPDFLISEAVRGLGAVLKTKDGTPFMQKYDKRLSLAPRDIVARAIDNELKIRGDDYVGLDCTKIPHDDFISHFPNIYQKCQLIGIDPLEEMIPVVPACHYMCGGIVINAQGQSSIRHLFATGECTYSGLHGANRLASNSLLEGLVFSTRLVHAVDGIINQIELRSDIPDWRQLGTTEPKEMVLITQSWKELKEIMSSYVGIVRNNVRLQRARVRLQLLYAETEELYKNTIISPQLCELRNLITVGYLVTRMAADRKESRGLHFTTDYPQKQDFLEVSLI